MVAPALRVSAACSSRATAAAAWRSMTERGCQPEAPAPLGPARGAARAAGGGGGAAAAAAGPAPPPPRAPPPRPALPPPPPPRCCAGPGLSAECAAPLGRLGGPPLPTGTIGFFRLTCGMARGGRVWTGGSGMSLPRRATGGTPAGATPERPRRACCAAAGLCAARRPPPRPLAPAPLPPAHEQTRAVTEVLACPSGRRWGVLAVCVKPRQASQRGRSGSWGVCRARGALQNWGTGRLLCSPDAMRAAAPRPACAGGRAGGRPAGVSVQAAATEGGGGRGARAARESGQGEGATRVQAVGARGTRPSLQRSICDDSGTWGSAGGGGQGAVT
jgi:hypothetical protein